MKEVINNKKIEKIEKEGDPYLIDKFKQMNKKRGKKYEN